jgi:hypothetical protein
MDHNSYCKTITIMQSDVQNGGLADTSLPVVPSASKQTATTSDFCIIGGGTVDIQSKIPELIRRVRFLEDVVPRSSNITQHDEDNCKSRSLDTLKPPNSTFPSTQVPDFDDEGSIDTLDGIDSANDNNDDSLSLSDLLLYAAEAKADVDEERRQHFLWSCAPRTKKTETLESVTPR